MLYYACLSLLALDLKDHGADKDPLVWYYENAGKKPGKGNKIYKYHESFTFPFNYILLPSAPF